MVNDDTEGPISGQVNVFDDGELLQHGHGGDITAFGKRELGHTTLEERDEESTVEMVPLGTLAEPAGAVVVVHVGWRGGELQRDEVGDGYGWEEEEKEHKLGGANSH